MWPFISTTQSYIWNYKWQNLYAYNWKVTHGAIWCNSTTNIPPIEWNIESYGVTRLLTHSEPNSRYWQWLHEKVPPSLWGVGKGGKQQHRTLEGKMKGYFYTYQKSCQGLWGVENFWFCCSCNFHSFQASGKHASALQGSQYPSDPDRKSGKYKNICPFPCPSTAMTQGIKVRETLPYSINIEPCLRYCHHLNPRGWHHISRISDQNIWE